MSDRLYHRLSKQQEAYNAELFRLTAKERLLRRLTWAIAAFAVCCSVASTVLSAWIEPECPECPAPAMTDAEWSELVRGDGCATNSVPESPDAAGITVLWF